MEEMASIEPMNAKDRYFSILLAEDDPDDQMIVRDALANVIPNASLAVVENGKEALQYLESTKIKPNIFITDIQMPLMTGLEVLACIRNSPSLNNLIVVILSTSKEADDIRKSKELGAALYISKPLMYTEWVNEMKRVEQLLQ